MATQNRNTSNRGSKSNNKSKSSNNSSSKSRYNNQRTSKKKSQPLSPTFKAGLILIIVIFGIWGVLTSQDAWYEKPEDLATSNTKQGPVDVSSQQTSEPVIGGDTKEPAVTQEPTKDDGQDLESKPVIGGDTTENPKEETKAEPVIQGSKLTNAEALNDSFNYNDDVTSYDNSQHSWSFRRNKDHTPVEGYSEGVNLGQFDSFHIVDTSEKTVYLTFDEGYELGYTESILDTLSDNGVTVAFFVTEPYIRQNPDLVIRMKEEGHIVANHSVHHYDGNTTPERYSDIAYEATVEELKGLEQTMLDQTGYPIDLFFRPPGGVFSERSLYITRQQGYKTVFWSMAYQDWYVDNQPGKEAAYEHVMTNYHPGAVILLHAVSESNTQALDSILKALKSEGYRFGSLYEIPSKF